MVIHRSLRMTAWLAIAVVICLASATGPSGAYQVPTGESYATISPAYFTMGQDNTDPAETRWYLDEDPTHTAQVTSQFAISINEVTNAQFAEFLNAVDVTCDVSGRPYFDTSDPNLGIELNYNTWQPKSGLGNMPMVEVTWYGAKAYCEWRGGRLPTEAEWELAARSTDGRKYPWGDLPEPVDSFGATPPFPCSYWYGNRNSQTKPYHLWDVGHFPNYPSQCGAMDMSGNAWEWTMGGYSTYSNGWLGEVEDMSREVVRGGSWTNSSYNLRCAVRCPQPRNITDGNIGFRVVWSDDTQEPYIPVIPVRTTINEWVEHFTTSVAPFYLQIAETKVWWPQNYNPTYTIQTGNSWFLASTAISNETMARINRNPTGFTLGELVDITARIKYDRPDRAYARASVAVSWGGEIDPPDGYGARGADENTGYPWFLIANNSDNTSDQWRDVTCRKIKYGSGQFTIGFGMWRNLGEELTPPMTNHRMWVDSITVRQSASDYPIYGYVTPAGTGAVVKLFDYMGGNVLASGTTDANGYYEVCLPESDGHSFYVTVEKPCYYKDDTVINFTGTSVQADFTLTPEPPKVISTYPPNGAVGASLSSIITAEFDRSMNAATINTNTFTVVDSGSNPVAGSVTYDSVKKTATFTPTSSLSAGMTYTATITTGAQDTNGWYFAGNYVWSFTTTSGYHAYVKWNAPGPTHDGSSWDYAFLTVAEGIDAADAGEEVWVAGADSYTRDMDPDAGKYVENIMMKSGVKLLGGFTGYGDYRNSISYTSILDGDAAGAVIDIPAFSNVWTVVDGFTIQNGGGEGWEAGGIHCSGPAIISNNVVTGNTAIYTAAGITVDAWAGQDVTVENNSIVDNDGGGLYVQNGDVKVIGNDISRNSNSGLAVDADCSDVDIVNNVISGNTSENGGAGIFCLPGAMPTITNNTIIGNTTTGSYGGGGIYLCDAYCAAVIENNIIAFNTSDARGGGIYSDGHKTFMDYNDVYGNTSTQTSFDDYYGISPGVNDISVDPGFYDPDIEDYRLTYGSDCIDAGLDAASAIPDYDKDGRTRIVGSHVDMGAYEHRHFYVSKAGNNGDGSSWAQAKTSIQTMAQAATKGDEIWVAHDDTAYNEGTILLKDGMKLLGGFSGSGAVRDWNTYPTAITACYATSANQDCSEATVLEGFTITGTGYYLGGGCINSGSPTITHNVFSNCSVQYVGGAISTGVGSPRIVNNVFYGNTAGYQGGAIGVGSGSPKIVNNTFMGNTTQIGGAIYIAEDALPTISNNIICDSTGYGVYNNGGSPTVTNNCLYNNSPNHYYGVGSSTGDVTANPLFASGWHIASNSPCIDAGDNNAPALPWIDIDGEPRPDNEVMDIGADEYIQ